MSSIYRKGRDGYFYYQTYVRDLKTGKKSKRIFHSLGTKDRFEAESKQEELDSKYEKNIKIPKDNTFISLLISNNQNFILISITVFLTLYFSGFFNKDPNTKIIASPQPSAINIPINKDSDTITSYSSTIIGENYRLADSTNSVITKHLNNMKIDKESEKIILPEYSIVRVERLSGAFEQGKIYLTVNQNTNSQNLLYLCEKITKEYSGFANIVICLYSDNEIGNSMASGEIKNTTLDENQNTWLAMYTYNSVEGAYFDDNPNGYLGVLNNEK